MANPLSPLSPSKQNRRSPFGSTSFTTFKAQTPLFDNGKAFDFTPERDNNLLFNDENSPLTTQKRDSTGWAHSPRGDVADDCGDNGFDAEEEPLEDAPPSSPFQEIARDPTTVVTDFARMNEASTHNKIAEEQGEAQGDVEMMEGQGQPIHTSTEPQDFDFGNDSLQLNPAKLGEEKGLVMDSEDSVIHSQHYYQQKQTGLRKVSNVTVSNEGMSAVFHESTGSQGEDVSENGTGQTCDVGDESCLSTFSAVPNADMTLFAKLRADSPAKRLRESLSPRKIARPSHLRESSILNTPGSVRSYFRDNTMGDDGPPPTSPRRKYPRIDEGTNLLDFTDEIDCPTQTFRASGDNGFASPSRRAARRSPTRKSPVKINLLDFDIPPAPTPRSIPSITPRELETLKSSFMSQISSLKATLSGRDAEVASLKEAVTDAERRVGEAMEEVRNEAARKEALEAEQREWERRGKEMESVLRGIKNEIVEREVEKDLLTKRADEAEKAKEALECRIVELESQLSAARESANSTTNNASASAADNSTKHSEDTAKEVQDAVEKVARELHGLYKSKHETKVAALKKSYEARWEKRVREAENKLKEAIEENERVKAELEAALSNATHSTPSAGDTTILRETEELEAQKKMLEAKVKGLEQELVTVKQDSEALREQLRVERAEKNELVAVVDEWLAMQQDLQEQQLQEDEQRHEQPTAQTQPPPQRTPSFEPPTPHQPQQQPNEEFVRKPESRKRPSMGPANGPSSGVSGIPGAPSNLPASNVRPRIAPGITPKVPRFAMPGSHIKRGNSGNEKSNIGRIPGPGRSGIMSSIERMGRGGN